MSCLFNKRERGKSRGKEKKHKVLYRLGPLSFLMIQPSKFIKSYYDLNNKLNVMDNHSNTLKITLKKKAVSTDFLYWKLIYLFMCTVHV